MIHVCFSLYDKTGRYSKFTGTTICSLFENTTSDVTVHILHDNTLTADNRDKFIYLVSRYGQAVNFYNVDELCAEKLDEILKRIPFAKTSRLSVAALYRLLIPNFLSAEIEKIIYLDSDIVVNMDINELWKIDLAGKIFAAVAESSNGIPIQTSAPLCLKGYVASEDYFNSGVLMMDLKIFRSEEKNLMRGVAFVGTSSEFYCLDQDVLNYLFSKNYLKLPEKFNAFVKSQRYYKIGLTYGKIYHYTAMSLGFGLTLDMSDPFNRLWMDYFIKTPWFNIEAIERLYEGFLKVRDEQEKAMLSLSAVVSGKTRAFIVAKNGVKLLFENFSVREDEEVLVVSGGAPNQKIIDIMNASRGKKIFFFLLPNFPFKVLEDAGLVFGKDFLDGKDFLLEDFNSHQILEAM